MQNLIKPTAKQSSGNTHLWKLLHLHCAIALKSWLSIADWACWVPVWLTIKNNFGHGMSAWQLHAIAHSPHPLKVTATQCHEKQHTTAPSCRDDSASTKRTSVHSFSISSLGHSNDPRYYKFKICSCKKGQNLDFLLTLCSRWSSQESFRRCSETMTEDLSHPQLKGIALGTEKLLDVYRWDSFMTTSMQCAVKLCQQPVGSSFFAPNHAQQDQRDQPRIHLLLIRRQNHCELPELHLSKQQKHSQSARKKNSNCIFLFSSFHQLQKTGKKQDLFLREKQTTKLRAFIVVRKPSDHTIPIST